MKPKHIGIILDGNRRFAKRLMLQPWKGHEFGAEKLEKLFDWCAELDINELTLYVFSIQNFNRPKREFDYLMGLFKKEFERYNHDKKIVENDIRINFVGRLWMLPEDIQKKAYQLMERTKHNNKHIINFALAYGGREEVVDAVKRIAEQVKDGSLKVDDINEDLFADNLCLNSSPDLIIRTGGERRTSNFLIWQANYSEWCFLEKTWPEFEKEDLIAAVKDFEMRERRFGR